MDNIATRGMWKTRPLPKQHELIPLVREYTDDDMAGIQMGLIPLQMEDKWYMFFEDNTLYVHRSWTGFCIYEADFYYEETGWVLRGLRVNRDEEQYQGVYDDVGAFEILVSWLVEPR